MKNKIFSIILFLAICFISLNLYAFPPSSQELYNGIDVSEWQGEIDYVGVKNSGIDIVYIRSSEGNNYIDPYFQDNYINAKEQGLKVGFYHFLTARSEQEAREQAEFFVSVIGNTKPDCRLAMDFEVFRDLGLDEINNIASTFLETVQNLSGKEMVIYSDAYNAKTVFSEELSEKYPIWVANYGVVEPENNGKWDSWVGFQYSDVGRINGIRGNVDRDLFTSGILLEKEEPIPAPEKPTPNPNSGTIVVKRGDTLSKIAMQYNTSYQYLAKINNIPNPNLIYIGEVIKVPNYNEQEIHDTSHTMYIVKRGDTLSRIAMQYNTTYQYLAKINNILDPNLIFVGEVLRIPTTNNVY